MAIKNDILMSFFFFKLIHDQNFSDSSETVFKERIFCKVKMIHISIRNVPLQIGFVQTS